MLHFNESELLYQSVVRGKRDCIMIVDLDGIVEFINEPGTLSYWRLDDRWDLRSVASGKTSGLTLQR